MDGCKSLHFLNEKVLPMREKLKEWDDEEAQKKSSEKEKDIPTTKKKDDAKAKNKNYAPYHFHDGIASWNQNWQTNIFNI